jgi:hypothetical protein
MKSAVAYVIGLASVAVIGLAGLAIAQPVTLPNLQTGLWEVVHERSGGPGAGRSTSSVCVTAQTLSTTPEALFMPPPPANNRQASQQPPACTLAGLTANGTALSFTAVCQSPRGEIRLPWTGSYTTTSFDLRSQLRMGMMRMNAHQTGRLVGPCPATR